MRHQATKSSDCNIKNRRQLRPPRQAERIILLKARVNADTRLTQTLVQTRGLWAVWAFLAVAFLLGGGSRGDIPYLILLRPLAVATCGYALWRMRRDVLAAEWHVPALLAVSMLLVLLHLIPLPPAIWRHLPGHAIVVEIERAAGMTSVWRPLSLSPADGWNAFFSMFVPMAAALLLIGTKRSDRASVLPLLIALAVISGLLGIVQVLGGAGVLSNHYGLKGQEMSATGLFTNRNHAAMFLACLPPMLAVWCSEECEDKRRVRFRRITAFGIGFATIPLLLVTGSRGGLLAGLIGLTGAAILYRPSKEVYTPHLGRWRRRLTWLVAGVATLMLIIATVMLSRALAVDRLLAGGGNEIRFRMWGPVLQIANSYFPLGSGAGSFVRVYQMFEPTDQLRTTYANHVHNDWLEVYMTLGLPGVGLLILVVWSWMHWSFAVWWRIGRDVAGSGLARLGSTILLILGITSISDYPLRVPSLACVAVVAAIWLYNGATDPAGATLHNRLKDYEEDSV